MKVPFAGVCLAVLLSGLSAPAQAVPITFVFNGIVDSVSDPDHDLDGLVVAGNTFSGTYTFESTTPGAGYYISPTGNVSLMVGNLEITAGPPRIMVWDAAPPYWDQYTVSAATDSIIASGFQIVEFLPINFHYGNNTSLSSADLLTVPPPLPSNAFSYGLWIQGRGDSGQLFTVAGTVTNLTPEPSSSLLIVISAAILGQRRRIRS